MADSGGAQKQRRRLFSRRELRHLGTYVVQVGSQNVLEKHRGRYTYSKVATDKESVASEPLADRESIGQFVDEAESRPAPERGKPQPVHRLTDIMRARRLRVSPKPSRADRPAGGGVLSSFSIATTAKAPRRSKPSAQLTPLRAVPDKLRPARAKPPLVFSIHKP
ncbi:hypothetical protein GGI26_006505 [Coemansia sp. RSA 1358]|nr:hypothetical protein BX070DRAFT_253683 [Coemansia spiralis]KAJ2618557.1 hypothetical protein GGI26_006505 [Coemansia sp. RSA 1358]